MDETQTCKGCQTISPNTYFFCPNCGKKLKDKSLSTSIGKQIVIYLISFFLPPFGLPQGIKYLRQNNWKGKTIGIVIILLTIISISISIIIVNAFMSSLSGSLNSLNSYQGLGL